MQTWMYNYDIKKTTEAQKLRKEERKMKKFISIILTLTLICGALFALSSCGATKYEIAVQSGTTAEYFVNGDADWEFDGISGFTAKCYDNGGLAVTDLKNGVVKYAMIDEQPAKALVKTISGVKVIDIPLTVEEYAFGVDKNQPQLLADINAVIAEIKANGTLTAIVEKYATNSPDIAPIESASFDASRADKQLVIATNAEFSPFEYKDGNKFAGIDMEIMKYVADKLGLEIVIMDMKFEAVVESVGKNGIDIAVSGLTVNEKRKEFVNFTDTYYNASQLLIVAENDTSFDSCKTADDVIAVLEGKVK